MGLVTWMLARPGVRYGVLLVAVAAGLVGSAALLGHAVNAPSLRAYQQAQACGLRGAAAPNCRLFVPGTVLSDRPYPLGIHALTLSTDGGRSVYYGRAEEGRSPALGPGSEALVVMWRGRAARVVAQGLVLEPFAGPPGSAFLLIIAAILSELVCALALGLQGVAWRLRARVVPMPPPPATWVAGRPRAQLVFMGALVVALVAGRTGHATVAAPLHAACGLVAAGLLGAAGLGSARALAAEAGRGLDSLSDEPALRLGSDVALAAVLVALCLSLTADLVVNDLITLPR